MVTYYTTTKTGSVLIGGTDVSKALNNYSIQGTYSNAIASGDLNFSLRALAQLKAITEGMVVNIVRKYTTYVDDVPTTSDYPVFDGTIRTFTNDGVKTVIKVDDMLARTQEIEINKIYGTEAVPVDLAEIAYDVITTAGLAATYNTAGATIQTSGVTTKGLKVSHKNGYALLQDLLKTLNWQMYYSPLTKKVYVEPKGFQSANPITLTTGVNVSGYPKWSGDRSQLCNSITVQPRSKDMVGPSFEHTLTNALSCSLDAVLTLTVPRKPYKFQVSVTFPSDPNHYYMLNGRQCITPGNPERRTDEGYSFIPNYDGPNLYIFQNHWVNGSSELTTFHDFPAGTKFYVMYYYSGPIPQTYKDDTAIAANDGKAVSKTLSRTDLDDADALEFGKKYVAMFKEPLVNCELNYVQAPAPFVFVGQTANVVDNTREGRTENGLVIVGYTLNYPKGFDVLQLGEIQSLTSDYTTSLAERIKNLESSALDEDYTQGQYTPLGYNQPGGGETETTVEVTATASTVHADGTSLAASLGYPLAHKVGYAQGRWLVFYGDGSNILLRTKTPTGSWAASASNPIRASSLGYDWCMEQDGTYLHYIWGSNVADLKYRRYTINADGTLTPTAAEGSAGAGGSSCSVKALRFTSDGALIYVYRRDNVIYVNRMTAPTTGSWASDSGWPKAFSVASGSGLQATMQLLSMGKFYVVFGQTDSAGPLLGRLWDGSALVPASADETVTLSNLGLRYGFTVTADADDNLHLAYLASGSDYRIKYRRRNAAGGWDAAELDVAGAAVTSTTVPYITIKDGAVVILWEKSDGHIWYNTVIDGVLGTPVDAYTDSSGIAVLDQGNIMPSPSTEGTGFAYLSDAAANYSIKFLELDIAVTQGAGGGTGGGGGGTPSSGGRTTVAAGGVLNGPDGNAVYLKGFNDSATLADAWNARGGSWTPDSTASCPVTYGGQAINTSSAEQIATFFYRYGLRLKADGFNYVRMGPHQAYGLDAAWTAYNADVTQFDRVLIAAAQGLEAAGIFFSICLSGFAEQTAEEGGYGYANRRLQTSQTTQGQHLAATGYLTDNILHKDSASYNYYAGLCIHVGDKVGDFPHFVALELSNEPDNWRQMPVYWNAQYGNDMSAYGAVEQAQRAWGSGLAAKIRAGRTKTFNITMGWTPLPGPPWHVLSTTGAVENPANLIAYLNYGMDIAGCHVYHFSPIYCDSQNSGLCDGTTCGQSKILAAIKSACAVAGMPVINNEWGRYCDSFQTWVQSVSDYNSAAGVHQACIVPPSRNACGSATLPAGWSDLPIVAAEPPPETTEDYDYIVTVSGGTYTAKDAAGTTLTSGTNAHTVIAAAITALGARTTKKKVLLQGDFVLTQAIALPNYTILQLDGKVTRGANDYMITCTSVHDIDILGGEWDGNQAAYTTGGIDGFAITGCSYITVGGTSDTDRLNIYGTTYHPIACGTSHHLTMRYIESHDNGSYAAGDDYRAPGIMLINCQSCLIEHNYVHDTSKGGIYFYTPEGAGSAYHNDNNTVRYNTVARTYCSGIEVAVRGQSDVCAGNIVQHNLVIDCGMDGEHPGIYIGWYGSGDGTNFYLCRASACTAEYNEVYETGGYPTSIGGIYFYCDDGECSHNNVHDVAAFGLACRCDDNVFDANTVARAAMGAVALAGADRNHITGSTFTACGDGVLIADGLAPANDNNHITGNRFENITGYVLDITTTDASGTQFDYNTLVGNHAINNGGTGTVIQNNTEI